MKSRDSESYLSVHSTLGLVAELEEEGVVSPPSEGPRTVNPRGDEHGVTQGRHQLAPGPLRLRELLGTNKTLSGTTSEISVEFILQNVAISTSLMRFLVKIKVQNKSA